MYLDNIGFNWLIQLKMLPVFGFTFLTCMYMLIIFSFPSDILSSSMSYTSTNFLSRVGYETLNQTSNNFTGVMNEAISVGVNGSYEIGKHIEGTDIFVALEGKMNQDANDIYFRSSNDGGKNFSEIINISNSKSDSEYSNMTITGNNTYIIWSDSNITEGIHRDLHFRSSNDGGKTFNPSLDISNSTNSYEEKMYVFTNNIYLTWNDPISLDHYNHYFRSSNDGGKTFNPAIVLSENFSRQFSPKLLVNGENIYVSWYNENNKKIYFKSSNDGGKTFNPAIDLENEWPILTNLNLKNSGNQIFVEWVTLRGDRDIPGHGGEGVYFKSSNDGGKTFNPAIVLSQNEFIRNTASNMLVSEDNIYVIWYGVFTANNEKILFRSSNDGGKTFNPLIDISMSKKNPEIWRVLNLNNNIFVLWKDLNKFGDLNFRSSNDGGKTFNPINEVSNNADIRYADLQIFNNNLYLVWLWDNGVQVGVYFKSSNDGGKTFNPSINLGNHTTLGREVSPILLHKGANASIVWEGNNQDGGIRDIFIRSSNDGGKTFHNTIQLSDNAGLTRGFSADLTSNNIYTIWQDKNNGSERNIFFRSSNDGGKTFNPTVIVNEDISNSIGLGLWKSGETDVYVLWKEIVSGLDGNIYLRSSNDGGKTFDTSNQINDKLMSVQDVKMIIRDKTR